MSLTIHDFQLTKWYDHEPYIIYRGHNASTQQTYLIKLLQSEYPSQQEIQWMTNEFNNGRNLHLDDIIRPIRMEPYESTFMLILEPVEGQPLAELSLTAPMEMKLFLQLAKHMTDIVCKLHQTKRVHLNLNPNAFWVSPDKHSIKLTDWNTLIQYSAQGEPSQSFEPMLFPSRLPYMAPEQMGRMNRNIDYRTDIYSLGVVFYQMVTGIVPFSSPDSMELIHHHLAKQPASPSEMAPLVPQPISDIIMKCLQKHPENRYQSAFALLCDLEACLNNLLHEGFIHNVAVGKGEAMDIFNMTESLYGREAELRELTHAFHRTMLGSKEFIFVSGLSGVGKSNLIQEFQKTTQRDQVLFISGKFDQFKRDTPFQAIMQAGQQIIQFLLTLDEDRFQIWKKKIMDAVGTNGQILADLNPDMEKIIGKQHPLPKLPPAEMHNRFLLTLQQFLRVFATKEQPLIVFLDDLQWADPASLQLLQDLPATDNSAYFMFIGTYRNNDITESHPLRLTIDKLERMKHLHTQHILLEPLGFDDVRLLLKDTLKTEDKNRLEGLTSILIQKTKGNPFFTKQFLRSLYDHQLLHFNYGMGRWEWDLAKIKELHITDNVVDLMINKIRRLPDPVQELLMQASCIGDVFAAELLALAASRPLTEIDRLLATAMNEGFIISYPNGQPEDQLPSVYKFLHDRVHQAVYSIVPRDQKKQLHYEIGKLMLATMTEDQIEEHLFDISNQLNLGKEFLRTSEEKAKLAELNMKAGRKAKSNTAYETALKYVTSSLQLLEKESWTVQYDLSFAVYLELAELEYLCGHFEEAKRSFQLILQQAKTKLEKAEVYNLMIVLYTNLGLHEQAMHIGLEGLRMFGMPIHSKARRSSLLLELARSKLHMFGRHPEELADLPSMSDPHHRAVMRLMVNLIAPTYFLDSELYVYLMLKMFNYSLRHGNSEGSALSYMTYGVIVSSLLGNLNQGTQFGQLGLKMSDLFDHLPIKCKVYFAYGAFTNNLRDHMDSNIGYLRQAYQFGVDSGDFVYAGYSIAFSFFMRLFKGDSLSDVYKESESYQPFIHRSQDQDTIYILMVLQRFMLFMKEDPLPQAITPAGRLEPFMGEEERQQLRSFSNKATVHTYYALQLQSYYMLDRLDEAEAIMAEMELSLKSVFGLHLVQSYYIIGALVITARHPSAAPNEKKQYEKKLQKHLRYLKKYCILSPDNFLHLKLLLEAEINRIYGNSNLAAELYEQAIFYANKNRFIQFEAMANECAAKFYMQTGRLKIARSYMMEAKSLYTQWGGLRKVAQLEDKYPYLVNRVTGLQSTMDVTTVAKASQALSSEPAFHNLLESFMNILIENAGAEKGILLLEREHRLFVELEKVPHKPFQSLHSIPLEEYRDAAATPIQYAARTELPLLLHNAGETEMFIKDPYIQAEQPKSMLILPILKLGKMIGVLYLENNLATHVFQEERLDTLKLLTSEMAVTIENAKLYSNLEHKDYKLQLLEEQEKNIRLQLDEKERWVQSSEATMLNIRKAQHELINNVQTIHALLMMNKHDMAKDYISVWCKEIVQQSVVNSVKFPVLGVVLNNISLPCISEKINLQVTGHLECTFDAITLPISYFSSIVHNLLKNAIEAIPDDDPLRTLRLHIEEQEQFYKLIVFNSGSYVSEANRTRIFTKGFSTKSDTTNSGLGLHIVQNYLEHYEGSIECTSVEGEGTTFTVIIKKKLTHAQPRKLVAQKS
ncbi:AAA family ATPase [Paenibacillus rigui]|uniref:DhkG n=1 Tax=Paenibacillus rigui TaxID=554312 RepID=A0A229UWM4_9BACL|nr:AAA family ATPase [Paenibacillus rigui]OXM87852.1 DhkG [Paenibacillus rigui]